MATWIFRSHHGVCGAIELPPWGQWPSPLLGKQLSAAALGSDGGLGGTRGVTPDTATSSRRVGGEVIAFVWRVVLVCCGHFLEHLFTIFRSHAALAGCETDGREHAGLLALIFQLQLVPMCLFTFVAYSLTQFGAGGGQDCTKQGLHGGLYKKASVGTCAFCGVAPAPPPRGLAELLCIGEEASRLPRSLLFRC